MAVEAAGGSSTSPSSDSGAARTFPFASDSRVTVKAAAVTPFAAVAIHLAHALLPAEGSSHFFLRLQFIS
jgi:hypothetical protein